jgi:multidrug efflux system membrane fusion protein
MIPLSRSFARPLALALLAGLMPTLALAQGGMPAPAVTVAAPLARNITIWDEYTGRFEAREQVEVRARVSGFIEEIQFRDGQIVEKGQPLFTIDRRPFILTVEGARADLERTKAQVALAENEVDRADALTRNQSITARDLDQRRANLASAKASQQAAEAMLKTAELNLEWTTVRAPISGRISNRRVDAGNLVAGGPSGATLLTNIISTDPISFVFDASEADYLRYTRLIQASGKNGSTTVSNGRPAERESDKPVFVRLADESDWKREGKMDFIDNQLNARSGTIRARAMFENKDHFLTPGTFGRLRLFGGTMDAMLVPDAAIVSDQTTKMVLTVGPENKVVPKPVVLGPIVDGLRVVRSGLTAEDKVIINGIANPMVRPGGVVNPTAGEIKTATK